MRVHARKYDYHFDDLSHLQHLRGVCSVLFSDQHPEHFEPVRVAFHSINSRVYFLHGLLVLPYICIVC